MASFHQAGRPFTADAIERADVADDGIAVTITLAAIDARYMINPADVQTALRRAGWDRRVSIHGGIPLKPAPISKPAPVAPTEQPVPNRLPITQADIDHELRKRRQPPRMEPARVESDLADLAAAGGAG